MTWLTFPAPTSDPQRDAPWLLSLRARSAVPQGAGALLGSAQAARTWRWAPERAPHIAAMPSQVAAGGNHSATAPVARVASVTPLAPLAPMPSVLRVPPGLLRAMSKAARDTGLSESEIWVAAARAWLDERARDDEPQPPTPAGAALPVQPHMRSWAAIDTLLGDLRRPAIRTAPAARFDSAA